MSVVSVAKDFENLSLIIVAEFNASIRQVWDLWSDPRKLERWWGPPTHPATIEQHDLSANGTVSYVMTGPDGERSRGWWRVTTVDAPRSLEFVDGYAEPDGKPSRDQPITRVRVRLAERDGITRMELRFAFESREHMARLERWGAFDVFPTSVAQIDAILAAVPGRPGGA